MSTKAVAQMVSIMLYQKRFFPYYSWVLIGGLDEKGVGAVYTYDPVGSYEREKSKCAGSASTLITSFLDNQVTVFIYLLLAINYWGVWFCFYFFLMKYLYLLYIIIIPII
jgi:20S proteasome alpha/beta subunit